MRVIISFIITLSINTAILSEAPENINALVIAKSGLRMREDPSLKGSNIMTIPYGHYVQILNEKQKTETISGEKGRWVYVSYLEKQGWIFDAFIYREYFSGSIELNDSLTSGIKIGDKESKMLQSLGKYNKKYISGTGEDDGGGYKITTYEYDGLKIEIVRNNIDRIIISDKKYKMKSVIHIGMTKADLLKIIKNKPEPNYYTFPLIKYYSPSMGSYISLVFLENNILKKIVIQADRP